MAKALSEIRAQYPKLPILAAAEKNEPATALHRAAAFLSSFGFQRDHSIPVSDYSIPMRRESVYALQAPFTSY